MSEKSDKVQSKLSWKSVCPSTASTKASTSSSTASDKPAVLINPMTQSDCTVKAEALWSMKVANSNYSFSSCDGLPKLFQTMFEDSLTAKDFSMSRTKVSYVITHALGPYFLQQTLKDLDGAYYMLHFDETTTSQVKKQMDVLVRFFSSSTGSVQVRFLHALMFGHAFAEKVTQDLLNLLQNLKLPLTYLLSLSCDGPNANKSIKRKMQAAITDAGSKGLVDIGFCNIHVIHNAFRKGLEKFGSEAEEFCIDLFYFFKLTACRREDFATVQQTLGLDGTHFMRHVQSRWLSLLPSVERVLSQMPAIRKYFLQDLARENLDGNARYTRICRHLKGERLEVQLAFLQNVKPLFDTFLGFFQSESPLIHTLWLSLMDMTKKIMKRFLKLELVDGKKAKDLVAIDLEKLDNHMREDQMEIGDATRIKLGKVKVASTKKGCLFGMKKFYIAVTQHMITRLPLENYLLECLSCLHPEARRKTSSVRHIKYIAQMMPCVTPSRFPQ